MNFLPNRDCGSATDLALANAKETVGQFLIYLRERPLGRELRRSDDLPAPKAALIDAFRLLISHELRAEQSGQLRKVGVYIAQFRQLERGDSVESADWDQVFAEQDKLGNLFKLSARYARRDFSVPATSIARVDATQRMHS